MGIERSPILISIGKYMKDNNRKPKLQKRKKKDYWGPLEEAAVVEYLAEPAGHPKAEKIFADVIYEPLKKLVESIMFTYHLAIKELPIDEQVYDCMSFVTQKMPKFDHTKGHKSYSYFGTIAKNYMILKKNRHYKKTINSVDIENVNMADVVHSLSIEHEFENDINSHEFLFTLVSADIKEVLKTDIDLHPNIYKVGDAVVTLLDNYQYINLQNKRQFYFIVKELTGLQAKQITAAMLKIKKIFHNTYKGGNYG